MQTTLTSSIEDAARFLRSGGTVAFPTETVYGLGANVFDEVAVAKIFAAKERPADNPLIAHIGETSWLDRVAASVPAFAVLLIERFFPGPLTLVLPKRDAVPLIATAGLETIGVRMPRHDLARQFLIACGTPVVAPSANLSGRPSPTTWQSVYEDLDGRIDCILKSSPTEIGLESTVVDCTGERPVVLRQGAVTLEAIREVCPVADANFSGETARRSPGLRHRHYSPGADVVVVEEDDDISHAESSAYVGISDRKENFAIKRVAADADDYAKVLFEFFRECDRHGIERIYCQRVDEFGIGTALMDRIRRASQG